MINLYPTQTETQAQNIIGNIACCANQDTITNSELNYQQSHLTLSNGNFLKIQSEVMKRARLECSRAESVLLDYIISYSDNTTGKVYRSQKTIAKDLGVGDRQIRKLLNSLKSKGFVEWRKPRLGSACLYKYRYDMLNQDPATAHKCGTRADIPPAKPDITTMRNSKFRQSTLKKKEERSINTKANTSNFILNEEVEKVVSMTENWLPKYQTHKNLKEKLGVTDEFIEEETKSFQISVMQSSNPLSTKELAPDEWNRIFYGHCRRSLEIYEQYGSNRAVKFTKRLIYNENRIKNDIPIHTDSKKTDISKAIIYPSVHQANYHGTWTEEDQQEIDEIMQEYYRKNNTRPPKYEKP